MKKLWHLLTRLLSFQRKAPIRLEDYSSKYEEVRALFVRCAYKRYLKESDIDALDSALEVLMTLTKRVAKKAKFEALLEKSKELRSYSPVRQHAERLRDAFLEREIQSKREFFEGVEANPLTGQQRRAVLMEDDFTLVLAAAGTGKTSVIAAKVVDLVVNRKVDPSRILLLAYNQTAKNEITERVRSRLATRAVKQELLDSFEAHTFHGLGRKLLFQNETQTKPLSTRNEPLVFRKFVQDFVHRKVYSNPEYYPLAFQARVCVGEEGSLDDQAGLLEDEYLCLAGATVRSNQELIIANWLYRQGVEFEYERPYPGSLDMSSFTSYKPDFYLPERNVYLEHFGVDRNGKTLASIDSDKYNAEILTKREIHQRNKTQLIETFHYEHQEGALELRLKQHLDCLGFQYRPRTEKEIETRISELLEKSELSKQLQEALEYALSEGLSPDEVKGRLIKAKLPLAKIYGNLFVELWRHYDEYKTLSGVIDFDDMILGATEKLRTSDLRTGWDFVLVDEFQDISKPRFDLILEIKRHNPGSILYMVGDDWQSIYGFSGARVDYIARLQDFVGPISEAKIETTFRYDSSIAATAGSFVMKNPIQKQKAIHSSRQVEVSTVCLCSFDYETRDIDRIVRMLANLKMQSPDASFGLLFRTNKSLDKIRFALKSRLKHVASVDEESINFITVHRSKGLEFDYVLIFDLSEDLFPLRQMNYSPFLYCLRDTKEDFPYAEERRLFYVALTRGRKGAFLMASLERPSEFIKEMLRDDSYDFLPMVPDFATSKRASGAFCNKCREVMVWRLGPYGFFKKCGACSADRPTA